MTVAITGSPKIVRGVSAETLDAERHTPAHGDRASRIHAVRSARACRQDRVAAPVYRAAVVCHARRTDDRRLLCLASVAVGGLTLVEATAFAQPLASARAVTPNLSSDPHVPVAPPLASDTTTERARRRVPARSSSPHGPNKEQPSPVPQRAPEPTATPTAQQPKAVDVTRPAAADSEPGATVTPDLPSVPHTHQAPLVTAEPLRSPWTAAAAGGVAIGRKSKDAGVATAGFFTRFARRVAGSF